MSSGDFVLYGSYGYTGRLIVRRAAERGLRGTLAGRDREALAAQAGELGWPWRRFELDDGPRLRASLEGASAILHCAGPFFRTFRPVVRACLETGTHYLDITGEAGVFEALATRGDRAEAAGVMLLPGVGFDVVPTDCLAAHLAARLPSAARLRLSLRTVGGGLSRGTTATLVHHLGRGGLVRKDGRLTPVPAAWRTRRVDFGTGETTVVTIPWGDVSTAFHSTGIGDIEVYAALPAAGRAALRLGRLAGPLLRTRPVRAFLEGLVRRFLDGPGEEARRRGESFVHGEVEDGEGRRAAARMRTPEGYTFTARSAVRALERVLAGEAPPGFRTPSLAYGPDFALEVEGVHREDLVTSARTSSPARR